MSHFDFERGMDRIKGIFPKIEEGTVDEAERRWSGLAPTLWNRMVERILETCRFSPKPKDFKDVHNYCLGKYQADKSRQPTDHHCHAIGGEPIPIRTMTTAYRDSFGNLKFEDSTDPLNAVPCTGPCPPLTPERTSEAFRTLAELIGGISKKWEAKPEPTPAPKDPIPF